MAWKRRQHNQHRSQQQSVAARLDASVEWKWVNTTMTTTTSVEHSNWYILVRFVCIHIRSHSFLCLRLPALFVASLCMIKDFCALHSRKTHTRISPLLYCFADAWFLLVNLIPLTIHSEHKTYAMVDELIYCKNRKRKKKRIFLLNEIDDDAPARLLWNRPMRLSERCAYQK